MVTHHFGNKNSMNEKASGGLAFSFGFCGGGGRWLMLLFWGWKYI
jgi:hypothetical protein